MLWELLGSGRVTQVQLQRHEQRLVAGFQQLSEAGWGSNFRGFSARKFSDYRNQLMRVVEDVLADGSRAASPQARYKEPHRRFFDR